MKSEIQRHGVDAVAKVRALRPGGVLGVVPFASPVEPETFRRGVQTIEDLGFRVRYQVDPSRDYSNYQHGFAAGSVRERVESLHQLLSDDEVDVVLAARGGYGSMELLEAIDWKLLARSRKALIGASDITALLVQSVSRARISAIHGDVLGQGFANYKREASARAGVDGLIRVLSDPGYRPSFPVSAIRSGQGRGPVLGGNLSMFLALLGTPWDPSYDGAVLVLEEIREAPYRIARGLMQLKLAGKLDRLAALVLGRFSDCSSKSGPDVETVLKEVCELTHGSKYPIVSGLPFGHAGENQALALGCVASVTDDAFEMLESPLEAARVLAC